MGRPLKKDINGVEVIGKTAGTTGPLEAGIQAEFFDGELVTTGAIVKQRGSKTFVIAADSNINAGRLNSSTPTFTCVLQADEPNAVGEMRVSGFEEGSVTPVYISKLTKRVACDFNGNCYTWFMVDYEDSAGDKIRLVPIV